jgi:hypothetical protein
VGIRKKLPTESGPGLYTIASDEKVNCNRSGFIGQVDDPVTYQAVLEQMDTCIDTYGTSDELVASVHIKQQPR